MLPSTKIQKSNHEWERIQKTYNILATDLHRLSRINKRKRKFEGKKITNNGETD